MTERGATNEQRHALLSHHFLDGAEAAATAGAAIGTSTICGATASVSGLTYSAIESLSSDPEIAVPRQGHIAGKLAGSPKERAMEKCSLKIEMQITLAPWRTWAGVCEAYDSLSPSA